MPIQAVCAGDGGALRTGPPPRQRSVWREDAQRLVRLERVAVVAGGHGGRDDPSDRSSARADSADSDAAAAGCGDGLTGAGVGAIVGRERVVGSGNRFIALLDQTLLELLCYGAR